MSMTPTPALGTLKSGRLSRAHALLNSRSAAPPPEEDNLISWAGLPTLDDRLEARPVMELRSDDVVRNLANEAAERQPAAQRLRLLGFSFFRPFWRRG